MMTSFRKSKQNHSLGGEIFAICICFYPRYIKNFYNNYNYCYKKTGNPIKKKNWYDLWIDTSEKEMYNGQKLSEEMVKWLVTRKLQIQSKMSYYNMSISKGELKKQWKCQMLARTWSNVTSHILLIGAKLDYYYAEWLAALLLKK